LLKKEKPGGETAGYLSTGQILAEKDKKSTPCPHDLCGLNSLFVLKK
jgi:hypothetical protein